MTETSTDIRLERVFAAPIEHVYAAWTDPQLLAQWYCPNPAFDITVEGEIAVGHDYRIHMGPHVVEGTYTTLDAPHTIAFSWQWAGSDDAPTQVRVELTEVDGGTLLLLLHTELADAEDSANHAIGWEGCLARLPAILTPGSVAPAP